VAVVIVGWTAPAAAQAAVTIETSTNGSDADSAPGPTVNAGETVTWTYRITVTGNVPLFDLIVNDSSGAVPDCDIDGDGSADGTRVHPGPLTTGQSFSCWASSTATDIGGSFVATGRVAGFDFDGNGPFEATDPSYHTAVAPFSPEPSVAIESLVNGADADGGPGPYIEQGTPIVYTYVVTNTGNVPLTSIAVANDAGFTVDCGSTANVVAGPLAPGTSVTCTSTSPAESSAAGVQTASASVEAQAAGAGGPLQAVTATDPTTYTPVELPKALAFTGSGPIVALVGVATVVLGLIVVLVTKRNEHDRALQRS
jgi:hypothetical protein